MTTIVYKGGVMVGDSRAYAGYRLNIGSKCKIHRTSDGTLIGASSRIVGICEALVDWYVSGHSHPNAPQISESERDFQLLAVEPGGKAYYTNNSFFISGPLFADQWAIGSGAEYALGAFEMGADPIQACEIAVRLDTMSGMPLFMATHAKDIHQIDPGITTFAGWALKQAGTVPDGEHTRKLALVG